MIVLIINNSKILKRSKTILKITFRIQAFLETVRTLVVIFVIKNKKPFKNNEKRIIDMTLMVSQY